VAASAAKPMLAAHPGWPALAAKVRNRPDAATAHARARYSMVATSSDHPDDLDRRTEADGKADRSDEEHLADVGFDK